MSDDEPPFDAYVHTGTVIVPLPPGTQAWCVWEASIEDGKPTGPVVEGPYPAVAIAQPYRHFSTKATTPLDVYPRAKNDRPDLPQQCRAMYEMRWERKAHARGLAAMDNEMEEYDELSYMYAAEDWPRVLILFPEFAHMESPWTERRLVYFTAAAAHAAAEKLAIAQVTGEENRERT